MAGYEIKKIPGKVRFTIDQHVLIVKILCASYIFHKFNINLLSFL